MKQKIENCILIDDQRSVEDLEVQAFHQALEEFCLWVLDAMGYHNWELSLVLCDSSAMEQFNLQFRGKDNPTDVLSFPQLEEGQEIPDTGLFVAGDIIVCPMEVAANSQEFKVAYDQEMKRILIHGILHLAGQDHMGNDPDEPMLARQEQILTGYNGSVEFLP